MAIKTINARIQNKIDTTAHWEQDALTPLPGELCVFSDTGKMKVGDGGTLPSELPYLFGAIPTASITALFE